MKFIKFYLFEYLLIVAAIVLSIAGFWNIFFRADAKATAYHYFHVITVFVWLFLLLFQLSIIGRKQFLDHKKIGLSILFIGPLLVATSAVMTVHSAYKGVLSGQGDALFAQNVVGTLELTFLILMAFVMKKRRAVHGAFLLSTAVAMMGVALFFTLLAFVPMFKIEGPETFYRFATAGLTGLVVREIVGLLFFLKDRRNNWPMLLAGLFPPFSFLVGALLDRYALMQPVMAFVGSFNELATFVTSFVALFTLLIFTGVLKDQRAGDPRSKSA